MVVSVVLTKQSARMRLGSARLKQRAQARSQSHAQEPPPPPSSIPITGEREEHHEEKAPGRPEAEAEWGRQWEEEDIGMTEGREEEEVPFEENFGEDRELESRTIEQQLESAYDYPCSSEARVISGKKDATRRRRLKAPTEDEFEGHREDYVDGILSSGRERFNRKRFSENLKKLIESQQFSAVEEMSGPLKTRLTRPVALPALQGDPSLFLRRSFRVGFGPDGKIAHAGKPLSVAAGKHGHGNNRLEKREVFVERVLPWSLPSVVNNFNWDSSHTHLLPLLRASFKTLVEPFLELHRHCMRKCVKIDTSAYISTQASREEINQPQQGEFSHWNDHSYYTDRCVGAIHQCLHLLSKLFRGMKGQAGHGLGVCSSFDREYIRQATRTVALLNALWGSHIDPWEHEAFNFSFELHDTANVYSADIRYASPGEPHKSTSLFPPDMGTLPYENYSEWRTSQYRSQMLVCWLASVIKEELYLDRAPVQCTSSSSYSSIFSALLCNDIEYAVSEAEKCGCPRLAMLLTQAGSELYQSDLLNLQYEQWIPKEGQSDPIIPIERELQRLYAVLAGRVDEDVVELWRIPWFGAFLLQLCYGYEGSCSIFDAYSCYLRDVEIDNAAVALPWYEHVKTGCHTTRYTPPITFSSESRAYKEIYERNRIVAVAGEDGLYGGSKVQGRFDTALPESERRRDVNFFLLSAFCDDERAKLHFDSSSITPFLLDNTIPWFLAELMQGLHSGDAGTLNEVVKTTLAQVETVNMLGQWEWGVYLIMNLLHGLRGVTDQKSLTVKAQLESLGFKILSQHIPSFGQLGERWVEETVEFFSHIGLSPFVWKQALSEKYWYEVSNGSLKQLSSRTSPVCGIRCFLESGQYSLASFVLVNIAAPDLMLSLCNFLQQLISRVFIRRESGSSALKFLDRQGFQPQREEPMLMLPDFRGTVGLIDFHQWIEYMMKLESVGEESLDRPRTLVTRFCQVVAKYVHMLFIAASEMNLVRRFGSRENEEILKLAEDLQTINSDYVFNEDFYRKFPMVKGYHRSWINRCSLVCLAIGSDLSAHGLIQEHRNGLSEDGNDWKEVWGHLSESQTRLRNHLINLSSKIFAGKMDGLMSKLN